MLLQKGWLNPRRGPRGVKQLNSEIVGEWKVILQILWIRIFSIQWYHFQNSPMVKDIDLGICWGNSTWKTGGPHALLLARSVYNRKLKIVQKTKWIYLILIYWPLPWFCWTCDASKFQHLVYKFRIQKARLWTKMNSKLMRKKNSRLTTRAWNLVCDVVQRNSFR